MVRATSGQRSLSRPVGMVASQMSWMEGGGRSPSNRQSWAAWRQVRKMWEASSQGCGTSGGRRSRRCSCWRGWPWSSAGPWRETKLNVFSSKKRKVGQIYEKFAGKSFHQGNLDLRVNGYVTGQPNLVISWFPRGKSWLLFWLLLFPGARFLFSVSVKHI